RCQPFSSALHPATGLPCSSTQRPRIVASLWSFVAGAGAASRSGAASARWASPAADPRSTLAAVATAAALLPVGAVATGPFGAGHDIHTASAAANVSTPTVTFTDVAMAI